MLNYKSFTVFITFQILLAQAYAQNKVGNGGDVVVCPATITLLDFHEETKKDFKTHQKPYLEIVREKFERFEKTAPKVFKIYLNRIDTIQSEIDFKKNIKLTDIKDSNEFYLPKNCDLQQIAIRKKVVTGKNEKRFIIDEDLWNKMDEVNKAGLISHEIIYEHFSKIGEKNSVNVRKVNRFIYASDSKEKDFWKLIQDLKVPLYP